MNFAEAFAVVGIAFAIAFAFLGFFWMLSTGGPDDYQTCMNGCKDGWGNYFNLECPQMCAELSEDYKFNAEYWYNHGTGRTYNNTDFEVLNDTVNYFKSKIEFNGCYYPPECYDAREDFLKQFPNQTYPNGPTICWYAIYCGGNTRWWMSPYE